MLLLKLQREGRGAAELWRCGVRATSRVPLQKVAWLLHLAACEARALPGEAPEEDNNFALAPRELSDVAASRGDLEQRAELVERLILAADAQLGGPSVSRVRCMAY
eukprot:Skav222993  [mRNA]  locus=scaffold1827:239166:243212:- [translate_table: standard]